MEPSPLVVANEYVGVNVREGRLKGAGPKLKTLLA